MERIDTTRLCFDVPFLTLCPIHNEALVIGEECYICAAIQVDRTLRFSGRPLFCAPANWDDN